MNTTTFCSHVSKLWLGNTGGWGHQYLLRAAQDSGSPKRLKCQSHWTAWEREGVLLSHVHRSMLSDFHHRFNCSISLDWLVVLSETCLILAIFVLNSDDSKYGNYVVDGGGKIMYGPCQFVGEGLSWGSSALLNFAWRNTTNLGNVRICGGGGQFLWGYPRLVKLKPDIECFGRSKR